MIKALKDTMVYPNEGEWWGHFADGNYNKTLTMKETRWYTEDLFGLKTADEVSACTWLDTLISVWDIVRPEPFLLAECW